MQGRLCLCLLCVLRQIKHLKPHLKAVADLGHVRSGAIKGHNLYRGQSSLSSFTVRSIVTHYLD